MKKYRTVEVPATTCQEVEVTLCDLCKMVIKTISYRVNDVEMSYRHGNSYPEGGSGEQVAFDVCGDCFDEKVVPWMESQGAVPTRTEWDH